MPQLRDGRAREVIIVHKDHTGVVLEVNMAVHDWHLDARNYYTSSSPTVVRPLQSEWPVRMVDPDLLALFPLRPLGMFS